MSSFIELNHSSSNVVSGKIDLIPSSSLNTGPPRLIPSAELIPSLYSRRRIFTFQKEPFISRYESAPVDVAGYISHILDQMPEEDCVDLESTVYRRL